MSNLLLCMRDNSCNGEAASFLGIHEGNDAEYRNEKFMSFIISDEQKDHINELLKTKDIKINIDMLNVSTGNNGFATASYLADALSLSHLTVEVFDAHIIKTDKINDIDLEIN